MAQLLAAGLWRTTRSAMPSTSSPNRLSTTCPTRPVRPSSSSAYITTHTSCTASRADEG